MKKRILRFIPLLLILAGSIYLFWLTNQMLKAKNNLELPEQVEMLVVVPTVTPTPTLMPTPTPAATPTSTPIPRDPEIPVLTLVSDTVELTVGQKFNVISVVADITDDVTDRNTLFRRIRVHGDYNLNVPGEYTLEYIVSDKDKHDSEPEYLTLVVKEP